MRGHSRLSAKAGRSMDVCSMDELSAHSLERGAIGCLAALLRLHSDSRTASLVTWYDGPKGIAESPMPLNLAFVLWNGRSSASGFQQYSLSARQSDRDVADHENDPGFDQR